MNHSEISLLQQITRQLLLLQLLDLTQQLAECQDNPTPPSPDAPALTEPPPEKLPF